MYYLSISDLVLIDRFKEVFANGQEDEVYEILFENGMDTTQPIEEEVVQHRNLQNQVVTCLRYIGYERTCREWKDTGAASLEAWTGSKDKDLREDLMLMSKEGYSDKCNYNTDNYKE